jgi:outer membrane protein
VRKAYLGYQSAQEQLKAAEAQLKAAQLALETTQERYQVGVANLVEVTQSRAAQVQAASAVVEARKGVALQKIMIEYYTGSLAAATP